MAVEQYRQWIQHLLSEREQAHTSHQLLELGVPANDIALAFHSPNMRRFTEPATH